jgi:group II intron reverse transcriptase/maturase
MQTGLERIAEKARKETKLVFTSLPHHLTKELIWESLCHIPKTSAPGVDGQSVDHAKENFGDWSEEMLTAIHRCGYKAPAIRRVYIPKPGKAEKRPIGIPPIADRALQRSASRVLSAIYEEDFLKCSFGGRPGVGAHNALCTFNEVVAGKKVSWVLECDLKNFFGSLDHEWLLRFVKHRVGDPRIICLIRRWLKAGILEDGCLILRVVHFSLPFLAYFYITGDMPQGGSISVLLSNIYLHYVLDLWFERVVKPRMVGEVYLIRYLDDFVVCFQLRADAVRFREVLEKRLQKFSLRLEPTKTRLVEFGRFTARHAKERGKRVETISFLGFTHFCTIIQKGNFMVGRKTEKLRQRRCIEKLSKLMQMDRHKPLGEQAKGINQILQGYYAYYGMGGNIMSLHRIYRFAERYWCKMLSSRSQRGNIIWEKFWKIKKSFPLRCPRLYIPFARMQSLAVL